MSATFFILHRYTLSFTTSPQFSKKYDIDISTKRIRHSNPLKPFVRDCTTSSKIIKRHFRPVLPSVQPLPVQSRNSSKHSKISTALPLSWWTSLGYFRRLKKGKSLGWVNNCFVIIVSKGITNIFFIKFKGFLWSWSPYKRLSFIVCLVASLTYFFVHFLWILIIAHLIIALLQSIPLLVPNTNSNQSRQVQLRFLFYFWKWNHHLYF